MLIQRPACEIAARFGVEVYEIQRQINFLRSKSVVHVDEIEAHNQVLRANGLIELTEREWLGLPPHHLYTYEIDALIPDIDRATAAIDRVRSALERRIDGIDVLSHENAVAEHPGLVAEWVAYFREQLSLNASPEDLASLRSRLEAGGDLKPSSEEEITCEEKVAVIDAALTRAAYSILQDRAYALYDLGERFEEIRLISESGKPGASMGTFRLAFIAMMAAFDAAIFDLVAVAVRRRFAELAPGLRKPDATKKEIAEQGDTDAVREGIIERRLNGVRARDLLKRLHTKWKVKLVGRGSDAEMMRLCEILARRNLQLHKRGVVDERYLEMDVTTGEPRYNPYNLNLGDNAVIDEHYWSHAKGVCEHCLRQVAMWAQK